MLFLFIFIILTNISYITSGNAGSSIFTNKRDSTSCWNDDDIVKLRARKLFEDILPTQAQPDEINGKYIREILRYFRRTLHLVEKENDRHVANLLKEAMADTIGAHLRTEILPSTRFAFYAGYVPYRNARQIHDFFDEIKQMLNTQGLGWQRPERTPRFSNLTVSKILIGNQPFFDPCICLVIKRDSDSCIHLPIPRLDDDASPSAIALPFKTGGLMSLTTPSSNNMLLKYYTTAARCILSDSPKNCRHSDFLSFNNGLWNWMKRDVAPHLLDEKLYAAYGGVLRIAAAVQTYGKGLTRRNLFEYQDASETEWHPWKSLAESYIYINADWSPQLYIGVVIIVACTIYLTLIVYNYICNSSSCNCKRRSEIFFSRKMCTNVETNMLATLPNQNTAYTDSRRRLASTKTKSASLGSVRTQKVYDLNENTEKLMAIMSGNETSAEESSSDSECEDVVDLGNKNRLNTPPKLETSISEVRVDRRGKKPGLPMFSTSTVTGNTYGVQRASDSVWSASESSSSQSVSSTTFKSHKSRSSRDLAWARRVISKHSVRSTKSSSRTELDFNSFTTPPSQR